MIAVTRREVRAWMLPAEAALDKRLARFTELVTTSGADDPAVCQGGRRRSARTSAPAPTCCAVPRVLLAGGRFWQLSHRRVDRAG